MIETYVMNLFECDNISIVIRGKISEWTADIVREYKAKFHNSEIIVSTWNNEKTDHMPCKIVRSVEPKIPSPHMSMIDLISLFTVKIFSVFLTANVQKQKSW